MTLEQFRAAQTELGERMFDLFDRDPRRYNSRLGDSLMWVCSATASLCWADAIDSHLDRGLPLVDALIDALLETGAGQGCRDDLLLLTRTSV